MQRVKHLKSHYVSARNVCQDYQCQISQIGRFHTEPMEGFHCYEKEETHLLFIDKHEGCNCFSIDAYGEVKNECELGHCSAPFAAITHMIVEIQRAPPAE